MNWIVLRAQLQTIREQAGLSPAQLGRAIDIDKSTIGRIEDVAERISHKPDLETIERWTRACGLTLGAFFTQLEQLQNRGLIEDERKAHTAATPESSEAANARAVVSDSTLRVEQVLTSFIETFNRVVERIERFTKARGPKPRRRQTSRPRRRTTG